MLSLDFVPHTYILETIYSMCPIVTRSLYISNPFSEHQKIYSRSYDGAHTVYVKLGNFFASSYVRSLGLQIKQTNKHKALFREIK